MLYDNDATGNIAQASRGIGEATVHSVKSGADDARTAGRAAADTVRAYAQDAVNANGRKIRTLGGRWDVTRERAADYVAEQPVRASLIAVAVGAVTTMLLVSSLRRPRRRASRR